ncbi:hypothetical protein VOLCADRAFT_88906 [Volvox carteri f. nagariensis]|uniref:Uncharacterized protein n=1 Tax=Volvox carteri f. nagariensis TaxID=3068 RepID=D8TQ98_VOLCA|nr:uncharacterized protein VOLCADRAFT_88906 [Volvox carteri f. nagariensis]EFJ50496.1 hypothetical protein VOLCADRAFT_88906 [Volvox carteri f. nagariensis]|eukprot:XP_002948621.1 hypothetical protein VOLCADRAFT_88906 [Volvox carteri f. nagariensis]
MALFTQLHVDQSQPSRLKESLDEAFTLVQALRQILETHQPQVDHAAMEQPARKPVSPKDASTQTEEGPDGMLREPPPGPSSPLATICVNTCGQLAATPGLANSSTSLCFGIVDAAVQQACRTLLTPQTASRAGATHLGALLSLQSTPAPASAATTPLAAGGKSRLRHHKAAIEDDASEADFSPVPFAAYQRAHDVQGVQLRVMAPPAAPTKDSTLVEGESSSDTTQPAATAATDSAPGKHPRGMNDGQQQAGLPPPPPPDAPGQPTGLSFTPNTTAVRLRAAMRWMQLQLQTSPRRVPRQRRYSDSSVSPALKILAPPEPDGGQHAVVQPALEQGAPVVATTDTVPVMAAAAAAQPTHRPQYARPSGQRPEGRFSQHSPADAAAAEPAVSAPAVSSSNSAGTGSQCEESWQPEWSQPLVWYAAAAAPAVAAPEGDSTSTVVATVGWPATDQMQPPRATASTDPWVAGTSGASVSAPLRDISRSVVSNPWRQQQQESAGNTQDGMRVGQHPKEQKGGAAAAKPGASAQQRRGSGLRFGLRW